MNIKVNSAFMTLIYVLVIVSALSIMAYYISDRGVAKFEQIYEYSVIAIVACSVFYCFLALITGGPVIEINGVPVIITFMIIMEMVSTLVSGYYRISFIKGFIIDSVGWPTVFLAFYGYSKHNELPACFKYITVISEICVCYCSLLCIIFRNNSSIFISYYAFTFLPMVFYTCSKRTSVVFSIVVATLMIATTKRAAFLIVIIGLVVYYLISNLIEGSTREKIQRLVGLFAVFIIVGIVGIMLIQQSGSIIFERLEQMTDDGGNGRVAIWEIVLSKYSASNWKGKLLGHGFHAVYYRLQPGGIYRFAHNSFVEILYDYGIAGILLLVVFILNLIGSAIKMWRKKESTAPVMAYCLVPMMIMSFASYFFEESKIIVPFCVIWGICMGKHQSLKALDNERRV